MEKMVKCRSLIGSNVCITAKANKPIEKHLMLKFNANENFHIKDVPVEMNVNDEKTLKDGLKLEKMLSIVLKLKIIRKLQQRVHL